MSVKCASIPCMYAFAAGSPSWGRVGAFGAGSDGKASKSAISMSDRLSLLGMEKGTPLYKVPLLAQICQIKRQSLKCR